MARSSSKPSLPPAQTPGLVARLATGVLRPAAIGLFIATLLVVLLLFAGSEDRGFIYIDF